MMARGYPAKKFLRWFGALGCGDWSSSDAEHVGRSEKMVIYGVFLSVPWPDSLWGREHKVIVLAGDGEVIEQCTHKSSNRGRFMA